jgi:hypothetical protein
VSGPELEVSYRSGVLETCVYTVVEREMSTTVHQGGMEFVQVSTKIKPEQATDLQETNFAHGVR